LPKKGFYSIDYITDKRGHFTRTREFKKTNPDTSNDIEVLEGIVSPQGEK